MCRIESQSFRILLLRRLRQSRPSTEHSCRCGCLLDSFGHHRSACPVAGVLGTRGLPLENAATRTCREGGGRVRTDGLVRDMDIDAFNLFDTRRLEVVVAPIAVDTTLVCPLTSRESQTSVCQRQRNGTELTGENALARLVVLAPQVGGRFSSETSHFLKGLASAMVRGPPQVLQGRAHAGWVRRWSAMFGCTAAGPSLCHFSIGCPLELMAPSRLSMRS